MFKNKKKKLLIIVIFIRKREKKVETRTILSSWEMTEKWSEMKENKWQGKKKSCSVLTVWTKPNVRFFFFIYQYSQTTCYVHTYTGPYLPLPWLSKEVERGRERDAFNLQLYRNAHLLFSHDAFNFPRLRPVIFLLCLYERISVNLTFLYSKLTTIQNFTCKCIS